MTMFVDGTDVESVWLQRGRAQLSAECPLLLLLLAQARNALFATACTDSVALVLKFSNLLVIICLF